MLPGIGPATDGSFVHDTAHTDTQTYILATDVSDILSNESCITALAMLHKHHKHPDGPPIRDRRNHTVT